MLVIDKQFADFAANCDEDFQPFILSIDEADRPTIQFDAKADGWIVRCTDMEQAMRIWKGRFNLHRGWIQVWIDDKILGSALAFEQPADRHQWQFYSDQLEFLMGSVNNDADHAERAVSCELTSELADKLRGLEEAIDRARELALEVELLEDRIEQMHKNELLGIEQ